ncbi:restriction endonuclease subunit S [Ligilactobacillus salivarius]|uniref:restriction endonuclease subunit S n=1 Tax=Ligilactobacillus salivarius TaxID=1624 RepID=UPI00237EE705|nr:restriction endonuclease subunit S [Ligilactobacillus salivarius]MDE1520936.1 restriction endonuclease subunit S [Ligilactobacillus salivarius]
MTQDKGVVYRDNLDIDIKYDLSTLKNYKLVQPGDFIISLRSFQGGFETSYLTGITSPAYTIFNFIDNQDKDHAFWQYLFKRIDFINSLKRVTFGIRDGKAISFSQFGDVKVKYPSFNEQKHIATALTKLDNTIQLHERKCEELNLIKKALLQKLFPKKDEVIPEVRYKSFSAAWEQRKLGDLAEIVRGASPRPISDPKWFDDNSDIGWLRISDVTNQNGRIYYLEQHISKLGQEKTRVITEPHLLLSIAATVGKPLINYIKTGVHDGFLIFLNPKFDLEYMYQWLEMFRPKWNKYGQPGSQVNLNSNLVRKQKIALPSREEQQRISSFLKQLDSLIALHQRKLEKLKQLKKFLLQNMFI